MGRLKGTETLSITSFERVAVFNEREKGWALLGQGLVERLKIGNIDILDLERVEEGTDVLG